MSTILITEFITSKALDFLSQKYAVIYQPDSYSRRFDLLKLSSEVDAIIVRNLTQVDQELLSSTKQLKVVGRLGVGLENIDLDYCKNHGIQVFPATGANAQSVAEYVVSTAVILIRGLLVATPLTVGGQWPRSKFIEQREAHGKTLGIVGLGNIGREVAKKASAFGFQCVAYDPLIAGTSVSIDELTIPLLGLEKLLNQSAVVTLHLPLLDSTKGLFSGQTLDLMQEGAFLVNTSRGQIVDEEALADRLRSGRLGGAAMDVFAKEPAKDLSHFAGIENILLTPHISGVTFESNDRVCDVVARLVDQALGKFV